MIQVNGENVRDAEGLTVRELLDKLGYTEKYLAVECDEQIIPRAEFDTFRFEEGNIVEVIRFVGGG